MAKLYVSPYAIDIPTLDIPSWIFSTADARTKSRPQYFDADDPASNFSLREAELLVKRLAKGIQDAGHRRGERILLYSGNSLYVPIVIWATIAAGCVFTGCSPGASISELSYQLQDSGATAMLVGPGNGPRALEAADRVGLSQDRLYQFSGQLDGHNETDNASGLQPWTKLFAPESLARSWHWQKLDKLEDVANTTAIINYSRLPKGVEISHHNLVSNSEQVLFKRALVGQDAKSRARKARIDLSGERWLAPLPMFHAYGQAWYCMSAAKCGAKVFIMPKYEITKWMTYLDVYRITFLTGVPTLMASLSKHPRAQDFNFSAVENVVTGSAPLHPEIGALIHQKLLKPGVLVKQGWGLTECTCSGTGFAPDDVDDGRSIGWINPNMRVKIVPLDGNDFGPAASRDDSSVGEIWISGPNVARGYLGRPRETAATFVEDKDGRWLRTGDIGHVDARGCLYIVDRLKELIKVNGLQVAPAEVEQTLLLKKGVIDCAVIGVKQANQERPKAFVVKQHGASLEAEELHEFVQHRLAKHKWLTGGVEFVESIPRTASGKVVRRLLSQRQIDNKL